jgi:hypothetical protein
MNHPILYRSLLAFTVCMTLCVPALRCFPQSGTPGQGEIHIIQDDKIDLLVSKHVQLNQNRNGIDGFRIQIFFDSGNNSKTKAQSVYEGFKARYPEIRAYLTFKSPNYKVRVGDFRTNLDAQRFLNEIIDQYPNAWIIADIINLPNSEN